MTSRELRRERILFNREKAIKVIIMMMVMEIEPIMIRKIVMMKVIMVMIMKNKIFYIFSL